MRRATRFDLVCALIAGLAGGCGARTGIDVTGGLDAGLGADARRTDAPGPDVAGPRDTPVPPRDVGTGCALTLSKPVVVFSSFEGPFDQPQVAVRGDGSIVFAARYGTDRPDEPSDVRARNATVGADGLLSFVSDEVILLSPTIWARVGATGAELATCSTDDAPTRRTTELRTWDALFTETRPATPLAANVCHDVVGRDGRWLLALRGLAEGAVVVERNVTGGIVRGPDFAFEPAVGANFHAAQVDDGFAWVGVLDEDGRTQVVFRDDIGLDVRTDFNIRPRFGPATPAIGAAFGAGTAAVAYYQGNDLLVSVVDRGSGVRATSPPLAFSMGADVSPALARVAGRVLVASLDYGDIDPSGGLVHIALLGDALAPMGSWEQPTRRDGGLRLGGIGAASAGEVAVVHWAERDGDGPARTLAVVVRCE